MGNKFYALMSAVLVMLAFFGVHIGHTETATYALGAVAFAILSLRFEDK